MADLSRRQLVVCVLGALLAVVLGVRQLGLGDAAGDGGSGGAAPAIRIAEDGGGKPARVLVHVAGAVRRPGVYALRTGDRVDDAVRRAGGATRKADLGGLNLAAEVEDGRQVLVPVRAGAPGAARRERGGGAGRGAAGQRQHRDARAARRADRRRPDHRAEDPRRARGARRLRLDRGARRDPGDRREAPGDAARGGDALTAGRLGAYAGAVRRHPRHAVLFAFVAGLLLGPLSPVAVLAAAAAAGAVIAAAAPRARRGAAVPPLPRRDGGLLVAAVLAALAVLTGAAVADRRLAALGAGGLPRLTGRAIDARAILLEPLQPRRDGSAVARVGSRATCACAAMPGRPAAVAGGLGGEVAVARAADGRRPSGVRVGSELRLRGTVAPLGDVDGYQRRRGAHAAIDVASWSATGRSRGGLAGRLDAVRERAADGLGRGLPPPEAALLRGMVLGQDEAIAEDVEADFRRSGLAHLLAVSGQNVLLLCMLVLAACAVLDVPLRARLIAAAVLVALYVPLAGGGPSIQRAGVMGIAGLVAALAGRPASRWYALGLAAAVTLVLNPRAAGEPGWQLSFAAVAGLLLLAPPLRALLARRGLPEPVADATAITVAATVATAPLLAFHFEQVSLASLPANLLAAPVVAPVMWLGMLGMTAAQVAPAMALPFTVACAPLLGYLEWVAHVAAGAPLAALPVRLGGPLALALAYAALGGAVAGLARLASARSLGRARPATARPAPDARGRGRGGARRGGRGPACPRGASGAARARRARRLVHGRRPGRRDAAAA